MELSESKQASLHSGIICGPAASADNGDFDEIRDESSCRHQETEAHDDCNREQSGRIGQSRIVNDSITFVLTLGIVNGYTRDRYAWLFNVSSFLCHLSGIVITKI